MRLDKIVKYLIIYRKEIRVFCVFTATIFFADWLWNYSIAYMVEIFTAREDVAIQLQLAVNLDEGSEI